jgi:hypothetical protein
MSDGQLLRDQRYKGSRNNLVRLDAREESHGYQNAAQTSLSDEFRQSPSKLFALGAGAGVGVD